MDVVSGQVVASGTDLELPGLLPLVLRRRCLTAGDPVDVVSGQVVASGTDLELPGLLPLVLRRAYASGYIGGRLHGQGWSSTLDQRLEIDADGIHYAGDDAQILHYPHPPHTGGPVLPTAGDQWPLTWDRNSGTFHIEDPESGWTRTFHAAGTGTYRIGEIRPIAALADRNGHRIDFHRDADGLPSEVVHSGGYRVGVDIEQSGDGPRIAGLRLLDGTGGGQGTAVIGFQYYPDGRLAGVVTSSGLPYVYEYDDQGRMTAWIDRNGRSYEYEYDEAGRAVAGRGPDGYLSAEFRYDTQRRLTTVIDALGHPSAYHWDEQHRVTTTVDPLGHTTLTAYDDLGRVLARTDELGRTTRYRLNAVGDTVRIDHPDGTTTEAEYTALRKPARLIEPGGREWHYAWDERGNLLSVTDPAGATTTYTYDDGGRPSTETDPAGHTTRYGTDAAGLIVAVTDPLGGTTRRHRDAFGRVVETTDPLGRTTRYGWTPEGAPAWRELPDGSREERRHDPEGGLLEHLDAAGGRTRYERTAFGQAVTRTDAAGARLGYEYDRELRLTRVTNATGLAWTYTYDPAGNLSSETDFNGRTVTYRHDAAGKLVERTNGAGQRVEFSWDTLGRVTAQDTDDGATAEFRYDAAGNLVGATNADTTLEFTHDPLGRVLTETADGRTLTNRYDPADRRIERRTSSGSVTTWQHDGNDQVTGLRTGPLQLSLGYDPTGQEIYRWIGDRTALTTTWDAAGRPTDRQLITVEGGRAANRASRLLRRSSWAYRADGMPISRSDASGTAHYDLDPLGQVTAVRAAQGTEQYAYDTAGNLLHASHSTDPQSDTAGDRALEGGLLRRAGRTHYDYDRQGRLVRSVRRTLSGRTRTWTFRYDAHDRLTHAENPSGESWRYHYDALGRRTAKQLLGPDEILAVEVRFSWDDEVLAEQEVLAGGRPSSVVTWEYEPQSWTPVTQYRRSLAADGTVREEAHAVITDPAGAPTELVSADGTVVWRRNATLWGSPAAAGTAAAAGAVDCPLRFPGQYHDDETGLDYNLYRYYDPETARFVTPDPLGLAPAPNHYAYVANPLDEIDPLGLAKRKTKGGGNAGTGNGGAGSGGTPTPTPPAPGSRALTGPVKAPATLPGFPGARSVRAKTPVQGGGGKRARWEDGKNIYEWDSQHGEVEKYNKQGKHLGAYDPDTGNQLKGPVPGRKCVK
ncbi:colicin E3/pyocin S6 family cytotoxin [Kitasatospora sp. NPDC048540]|uniref:colicin E3/pyocin S6 family cytotoxin n=1 Tax=Kitasatospora sp. NPDC048540 TaxID=3155634 RepID=UPI003401D15D